MKNTNVGVGSLGDPKSNNGITLIALIITIIIMLILVAVTLTIALNGGLFEKASTAGTATDYEAFKEQVQADVVGAQAEIYGRPTDNIPDLDRIETILKRSDYGYTIEEKTSSYIKVSKNGKIAKVEGNTYAVTVEGGTTGGGTQDWTGGADPNWSEPSTVTVKDNYTDPTNPSRKATIPKGFKVSKKPGETTIDQGLVVQGPDGSEFVWIPVANINDMIIPNGVSAGNHAGQLYTFTDNGATAIKNPTTYKPNSSYGEPTALSHATNGDTDANVQSMNIQGVTTQDEFKTHLQTDFNEMIASVNVYGGFYVGRYETGDLSKSKVVSKRGNTDINSQNWYTMYQKQKALYSSPGDSVVSGMIQGCQWDQMLKVIYASDNTKSLTDSSSWGNYLNVTFTYEANGTKTKAVNTNTRIPTGSTERNKGYNMYDVAGNVSDWTTTANISSYRTVRGRRLQLWWHHGPGQQHDGCHTSECLHQRR